MQVLRMLIIGIVLLINAMMIGCGTNSIEADENGGDADEVECP